MHRLRDLPVLVVLDKVGVADYHGIKTPWGAFKRAEFEPRGWGLYLKVWPRTQYKNIVIKGDEIGFTAMDEVKAFMREHAPSELTKIL